MEAGTKIGTMLVSYELKLDEYENFLHMIAEYCEQFMVISEVETI